MRKFWHGIDHSMAFKGLASRPWEGGTFKDTSVVLTSFDISTNEKASRYDSAFVGKQNDISLLPTPALKPTFDL